MDTPARRRNGHAKEAATTDMETAAEAQQLSLADEVRKVMGCLAPALRP
jgi:hypothetical protein